MEDIKLRELRRNESQFKDLSDYFSVIKDVFGDCETVPFIRGYLHFKPEDWTVDHLTP